MSNIRTKEVNNLSDRPIPLCFISLHQSPMSVWLLVSCFYTDLSSFHMVYLCFLRMTPLSIPSLSFKPFKSTFSQSTYVKTFLYLSCSQHTVCMYIESTFNIHLHVFSEPITESSDSKLSKRLFRINKCFKAHEVRK